MKLVIQLIEHTTGNRSEPFVATAAELRELLLEQADLDRENLLLCVGYVQETDEGHENMMISGNPILKISSFLETFEAEQIQLEEVINNE